MGNINFYGNASNNTMFSGDHLTVSVGDHHGENHANIQSALADLSKAFTEMSSKLADVGPQQETKTALTDAGKVLAEPKPERNRVGGALERVLNAMKKTVELKQEMEKLAPLLVPVVVWLGVDWTGLLSMFGP